MKRQTGTFLTRGTSQEEYSLFVPFALPPVPPVEIDSKTERLLEKAKMGIGMLNLAAEMVPDKDWFIYGFIYKEAVVSSQIEGTQATLIEVLTAEAFGERENSADIEEVVNYVKALKFCLHELSKPKGLPLSLRMIKKSHEILLKGVRGEHKSPGEFRRTQNWIGGTRPGNAVYVPPPPEKLADCLNEFEKFLHTKDGLHPLIRAALLHVQFESIHPFLDGNGRVGRLLITLLLTEWKLLSAPLLYLSLHFKLNRREYYERLSAVRTDGDWEGWINFFLEGVAAVSLESSQASRELFTIVRDARAKILNDKRATIFSLQLLEQLPKIPVVTIPQVVKMLGVSKPTAYKAINLLSALGILKELGESERNRRFAFSRYLNRLTKDT